jgi:hypothetical protein
MPPTVFHAKTGFLTNITASKKCSPVYFVSKPMLKALNPESCEVTEYG